MFSCYLPLPHQPADGHIYAFGFGENFFADGQNFSHIPQWIPGVPIKQSSSSTVDTALVPRSLGSPKTVPTVSSTTPFTSYARFKSIACGQSHLLAITSDGDVYAWGVSTFGQCGNGITRGALNQPRLVLTGKDICSVSCGRYHSIAISSLFSGGFF